VSRRTEAAAAATDRSGELVDELENRPWHRDERQLHDAVAQVDDERRRVRRAAPKATSLLRTVTISGERERAEADGAFSQTLGVLPGVTDDPVDPKPPSPRSESFEKVSTKANIGRATGTKRS